MRGPTGGYFPLPVFSGYRVAPGHPAPRCGVHWRVFLDSASHRVTPHHDAGSRKVPLVGIAFAGISGYRVVARYDVVGIPGFRVAPGHPAQRCGRRTGSPRTAMRGPFAGISGYRVVARYDVEHRIKCGMTERVFSGFRVAPGHPAQRCGVHWRVFPGYRVVARYDVEHRIKCGMMRRRGPEKCLLWVLPLPVFLDTAS